MTKIVQIILPAFAKAQHYGQTPNAFSQKMRAKFEGALVERSSLVLREEGITRLQTADAVGNTFLQIRRYTLAVDLATVALAEIVAASMDAFNLTEVPVILGDQAQVWTREDVEAFGTGIHAWNQEDE